MIISYITVTDFTGTTNNLHVTALLISLQPLT